MEDCSMRFIGTILQFDADDHLIGEYTGELKCILDNIENGETFYYRFPCFSDIGSKKKIRYTHFGLKGINTSCNEYSAEELITYYLNYEIQAYYRRKKKGKKFHCRGFENIEFIYAIQLQEADRLNRNTAEDFNKRLDSFLKRHSEFKPVVDLNDYRGMCGIYLLVLDKYNVCYIGQTQTALRVRIKQHWTRSDYFLRGIDRFKAMDTTRIYVYPIQDTESINLAEYSLIPDFPEQYTLNCGSSGGDVYFMKSHGELPNIEPDKHYNKSSLKDYLDQAEKILGIRKEL